MSSTKAFGDSPFEVIINIILQAMADRSLFVDAA